MRYLRFSIGTLLIITSVIAITIAWWPVPDGIRSFSGGLIRNQFVWFDGANAVVDDGSGFLTGPFAWSPSKLIEGSGSVVSLFFLEAGEATDSGSHTCIEIQLPAKVHRWQQFALGPVGANREVCPSLSETDPTKRSLMKVSEVAITHRSGMWFPAPAIEATYSGQLTILGSTKDYVTVKLQLSGLADLGIEEEPEIYTLERRAFEDDAKDENEDQQSVMTTKAN